mgnify:CR=1 FL=1
MVEYVHIEYSTYQFSGESKLLNKMGFLDIQYIHEKKVIELRCFQNKTCSLDGVPSVNATCGMDSSENTTILTLIVLG